MTSEIIVVNLSAVAMAADSLISVRQQALAATGAPSKAYNGTHKLVSLHRNGSVGAMYFKSPDFHGMPWSVVFAEYARTNGKMQVHASVQDAAEHFFRFVASASARWIDAKDVRGLIRDSLATPLRELVELWAASSKSLIAENDLMGSAPVVLKAWTAQRVARRISFPGLTTRLSEAAILHVNDLLIDLLSEALPGLWRYLNGDDKSELLRDLRVELTTIDEAESDLTGVAFAGFGEAEIVPSVVQYNISGTLGHEQLRLTEPFVFSPGRGEPSFVLPLAQRETVDAYLGGVHEMAKARYRDALVELAKSLPGVSDPGGLAMALEQQIVTEIRADVLRPLLDGLAFMSPYHVADLARSLVSMTALRNRVSLVADTVGGPFDVALITRSGGFTWWERSDDGLRTSASSV